MEHRKRPRLDADGGGGAIVPSDAPNPPPGNNNANNANNPTERFLQNEIKTLRSELSRLQSVRSIERTAASKSETRMKRQLADAFEEVTQKDELIDGLRAEVDSHERTMEECRASWEGRLSWYEGRLEEMEANAKSAVDGTQLEGRLGEAEGGPSTALLRKRLDAASDQVSGLEGSLREAEARRVAAEERAVEAERKLIEEERKLQQQQTGGDESKGERELRIKIAETERSNRELRRQNDAMKRQVKDVIEYKERTASAQRRVHQLEGDLQRVTRQVEEGREVQRRWMQFRSEIIDEGLILGDKNGVDDDDDVTATDGENQETGSSSVPPEISTVVRKFHSLKRQVKRSEDEVARVINLSESHKRRCDALEAQLNERGQSIKLLEKTVKDQEVNIDQLELVNRKITAQQGIWKRESEGMRSLLDTYEQQEVMQSKSRVVKRGANSDGLQLSLDSSREEVKLLSETNKKLESAIEGLRSEREAAKVEHNRVLEKFGKLRDALMNERSKAEAAEARACQAETLAGKGSYNDETTRVLHLKSNPLMGAMREKYQNEIDSLKRQLEAAGTRASLGGGDGTTTPAPSKQGRITVDSAGSRDSSSVDVQKLHTRLKDQFRNQIAAFRHGVYLITGFKIDMSEGSEDESKLFTVRSVYGEREEDHLRFKWSSKRKSKLDMLATDMAHLLMKGPGGVYVTKHGSWPAFMGSVTLQLFDQQTIL